jgi:hypothetical protein
MLANALASIFKACLHDNSFDMRQANLLCKKQVCMLYKKQVCMFAASMSCDNKQVHMSRDNKQVCRSTTSKHVARQQASMPRDRPNYVETFLFFVAQLKVITRQIKMAMRQKSCFCGYVNRP